MSFEISKTQLLEILLIDEKVTNDFKIFGLEFDSRKIKGGELFFALSKDHNVNKINIKNAYKNGASLIIVDQDFKLELKDIPIEKIVKTEPLSALITLASFYRSSLNIPVIGITGSVGKSTIKELLSAILLTNSLGNYSQKSFNNHIGVPYSLLKIKDTHNFHIQEIGMSAKGEIAALSKIVCPDIAVISKISWSHAEFFNSLNEIADAKLEIVDSLKKDAIFIFNIDDQILKSKVIEKEISQKKLSFGYSQNADMQIKEVINLGLNGFKVSFLYKEKILKIESKLIGLHNVYNLAAALLIALQIFPDISIEKVQKSLIRFRMLDGRLEMRKTKSGKTIINDAYNANLNSSMAFLDIIESEVNDNKKVAILFGDMLELGKFSKDHHHQIAKRIAQIKPFKVYTFGNDSEIINKLAIENKIESKHTLSIDEMTKLALNSNCDLIFIKSSNGTGLSKITQKFLETDKEDLESEFNKGNF